MDYTFSNRVGGLKPSAIREILKSAGDPGMISFSAGNPAVESFPVEELRRISDDIYAHDAGAALQYSVTEGYAPLREQLKKRLSERFQIDMTQNELLVTTGGQQGIDLVTKILCNEGDTVICEEPSFIGALNAFRSYGCNLKGVPLEEDGPNLEVMEEILKTDKRVKLIYLIPTFQNPAGSTTSLEKRKAILELAERYHVVIFEDNPYGELRFAGEEVPTLKSLDRSGCVVYGGSVSKILSAGLRIGFIAAAPEIFGKAVVVKQTTDVHTPIYNQMLAARFFEQCDLDAHIEKIRALYRRKCGLMLAGMDESFADCVQYTRPEGGLFLWVTLPEGADMPAFVKRAIERKVAVVPGSTFMTDESAPCRSFRMNYSTPSDEQIKKGVAILGELTQSLKG